MTDLTAQDIFAGLSFLVTVGGFVAAIWQIRKTKTAAESAEAAAKQAVSQMQRSESIEDLTSACQNLEVARLFLRKRLWEETLERFASVRQRLSNCYSRTSILSGSDRSEIQSAITHLSGTEERIEAFSLQARTPHSNDLHRFSTQLARIITRLQEVRSTVKNQEGNG